MVARCYIRLLLVYGNLDTRPVAWRICRPQKLHAHRISETLKQVRCVLLTLLLQSHIARRLFARPNTQKVTRELKLPHAIQDVTAYPATA